MLKRNRLTYKIVTSHVAISSALLLVAGPSLAQDLKSLSERATSVVVASPLAAASRAGQNKVEVRLQVVESLSPQGGEGELTAVIQRHLDILTSPDEGCGIWFLQESTEGVKVLTLPNSGPFLFHQFLPLRNCTRPILPQSVSEEAAVEDVLLRDLRENGPGRILAERVFPLLDPSSPSVRQFAVEVSEGSDPVLRAMGLGLRILDNDARALEVLAAEHLTLWTARSQGMLVTAVRKFRGEQPDAMGSLDRLLVTATGPERRMLRLAAANAARMIHSPESLPLLAKLLDAPDVRLQNYGIWGFSAFVAGSPSAVNDQFRSGVTARRAGGNEGDSLPAIEGVAEEERYFLRFEPIHEPTERATVADFWRRWWESHQSAEEG